MGQNHSSKRRGSRSRKGTTTSGRVVENFTGFKEIPMVYEFEKFAMLGKGSFGSVEGCLYRGHPLAVKRIPKKRLFRRTNHSALAWNERNAMISAGRFCVPLECSVQSVDDLFLIAPFYCGGDLRARLRQLGALPHNAVIFYLAEIIVGLEDMHSKCLCHRDIKPDNIFIDGEGHIAIGDMGLAIKIHENLLHQTHYWGKCGSYAYRAPEVVLDLVCGTFSDIYSLGITIYYLLFGGVPCRETKDRLEGKPLRFPDTPVPQVLIHLIEWMLELEPADRVTIPQIKAHAVFEGLDWEAVKEKEYEPPWLPDPVDYEAQIAMRANEPEEPAAEEPKPLSHEKQKFFFGFDWLPGDPVTKQGDAKLKPEKNAQVWQTPQVRNVGSARSPMPSNRTLNAQQAAAGAEAAAAEEAKKKLAPIQKLPELF